MSAPRRAADQPEDQLDSEDKYYSDAEADVSAGSHAAVDGADGAGGADDEVDAGNVTHESMAEQEFDTINGADPPELMGKLGSVKVPFIQKDPKYWFFELELQMTIVNAQSQ